MLNNIMKTLIFIVAILLSGCTMDQHDLHKIAMYCSEGERDGIFELRIAFGVSSAVCKDGTHIVADKIPESILSNFNEY